MTALSTFTSALQGRKVVLFSDNAGVTPMGWRLGWYLLCLVLCESGAEATTAKGSAKAFDHNQLVHEIWWHALKFDISLWVERVPSKYNIADSPSRFQYKLMHDLGATWCKPVLAELYLGKEE